MNNASLNQIVNKLIAFGNGHKYIKSVTHGQLDEMDLTSRVTYPLMHIVPQDITPSDNRLQFSFDIVFADLPRIKTDKPENVLEIQSDMEQIARDLYTEIYNGGVLFGDGTEVGDDWSVLPFQDEYHNYLSGVTLSINIIVGSNWNACEIPADWVTGEGADIPQFGRDLTIAIYDEGNFIVNAREVNFTGGGVNVTSDGNRAIVNITGGGGGGGLSCEDLPNCQTIIDIDANIDAIEEDVSALQSEQITQNNRLDALESDVSTLQGDVSAIQSEQVTQNTNITALQNDLSTLSNSLAPVAFSGDYNDLTNKPSLDFVQSVVSGDDVDVDATDPANPIVGVTPNTFLRLTGTETGFPVTGDIELQVANSRKAFKMVDGLREYLLWFVGASDQIRIGNFLASNPTFGNYTAYFNDYLENITNSSTDGNITVTQYPNRKQILISSNVANFKGYVYGSDFSADFVLRSLIDLAVLKKRLWTKAGAPTTTDDSTQGYVVGSLIFDTTNSILYRCTSATTGAAVWTDRFDQFSTAVFINLGFATIPAGATQYAPIGSQASFNSDETTRYTPQPYAAVVYRFKVYIRTAQPATGSLVCNLRANGVNISTITIPAGSAAGTYSSSTVVAVAENDLLTIGVTNNASSASAQLTTSTIGFYN